LDKYSLSIIRVPMFNRGATTSRSVGGTLLALGARIERCRFIFQSRILRVSSGTAILDLAPSASLHEEGRGLKIPSRDFWMSVPLCQKFQGPAPGIILTLRGVNWHWLCQRLAACGLLVAPFRVTQPPEFGSAEFHCSTNTRFLGGPRVFSKIETTRCTQRPPVSEKKCCRDLN